MRKSDKCAYSEPWGEHDEYQCYHPANAFRNLTVYPDTCAKCKGFQPKDKLLDPCPFCGNKPKLQMSRGMFNIYCSKCGAGMSEKVSNGLAPFVRRWNTRVKVPTLHGKIWS